jgi:uncharacterized protein (TIGR01777 family)
MKTVLITGGTGMIGSALTKALLLRGYKVRHLSRSPSPDGDVQVFAWSPSENHVDPKALDGVYAIIHLSGAPIAPKRWTGERIKVLYRSRGGAADLLFECMQGLKQKPEVFISASGVNYHGAVTSERVLSENDPPGADIIAGITVDWERAADRFSNSCRVVKLRTPVVLSSTGGALPKLLAPIRFGVGSAFGTGRQWFPWVHLDDLVQAYVDSLEDDQRRGVYHVTAPEHVTNKRFIQLAAHILRRPLWLPNVPGFLLRALLGKQAALLLHGTRVNSSRITSAGHRWKYADLESALRAEIGQ